MPNVLVDIPELRCERRGAIMKTVLGIPHYSSCAAGNWMMHIDSNGSAYPCYTFESSKKACVDSTLSVEDQWRLIKGRRAELGNGDICVGEALST